MPMSYDLVIIGSGSAGFAAAIAARRDNLSVLMIENDTVGGTCVNVGCIPSKALLAAAERQHLSAQTAFPGVSTSAEPVDFAKITDGKDDIVRLLRLEKYLSIAQQHGIEIIKGRARFVKGPLVDIDGKTVSARHYLIATGAVPRIAPIDGLDKVSYLTSASAMELKELPGSLAVIGGNAVGLEMAQMFSRFGSEVTLIEAEDRLAPFEEPEISETLEQILKGEGVRIYRGSQVTRVSPKGGGSWIAISSRGGKTTSIHSQALLLATGRSPNTSGLGLDSAEVVTGKNGEVLVDDYLRSSHPRIWAAGDVTGHPQFVYVAASHGNAVVANAFANASARVDYTALPRVTFTSPPLASAGLTEAQAEEAGYICECRVLQLSQAPRAIVERNSAGIVKMVADKRTGRILGVHMLGQGSSDVIQSAVYAITAGFTTQSLASIWSPYLTMAEPLKLVAQSFTTDISSLSCCAS